MEQQQALWDEGLVAAVKEAQKNAVPEGGGIEEQAREAYYDYSRPFSVQIDDWKAGNILTSDTLNMGATPEIWRKVGFNALPVTINQTHVDYMMNGTKDADHYLGETTTKELPSLIQRPVAIIQSQSDPSRAVIIIRKENNGKKVIAAVEVDGYGRINDKRIDSNAVTSVYGATNALQMLRDAVRHTSAGAVELFYWNKREAITLLQRAGLQVPSGLPREGFVHSIRDSGSNVKVRIGSQTETLQFKRWFGKSKVVNSDGTPKIMYHGTPNGTFTVFHNWQYFTDNQVTLDMIPKIKSLLENGYLFAVERTHLDNKHVPLYAYRIYNTFDYIEKDTEGNVIKRENGCGRDDHSKPEQRPCLCFSRYRNRRFRKQFDCNAAPCGFLHRRKYCITALCACQEYPEKERRLELYCIGEG